MDESLKDRVKKEAGVAVEQAARESRGREIPVKSVTVEVTVKGADGREAKSSTEVKP